jgi:hypothetical protein
MERSLTLYEWAACSGAVHRLPAGGAPLAQSLVNLDAAAFLTLQRALQECSAFAAD